MLASVLADGAAMALDGSVGKAKNAPECIGLTTAAAVFHGVADGLASEAAGAAAYPAATITHGCSELPGSPKPEEIPDFVDDLVVQGTRLGQIALSRWGDRLSCEQKARIDAAIVYVRGMAGPILEEVSAPDGVIEIPESPVNLAACGTP